MSSLASTAPQSEADLGFIFLLQPADPFDAVDPEYELRRPDYSKTNISIQDATAYGGGFVLNEYGPDENFWVRLVSTHRSLKAAKAAALKLYAERSA